MSALLGEFGGWIIGVLAIAGAFLGAYLKGRRRGKQREQEIAKARQVEAQRQHNEKVSKAQQVARDIANTPGNDVDKRLRDKWQRD